MINEKEEKQNNDSLDSLERVKTLSPGAMVLKRFFRNKLAIVGLAILLFMIFLCIPYIRNNRIYNRI